ncbi:LacI family DNA-binding transcriptional regulator [Fusibacter bizertensis]
MSKISDIAKEAGISVATVSRVINGTANVSPETKARVQAAIAKFNYQPNVWGRRLRRQESRMILVFVPNIRNPYYASIVSGIEETARRYKYGTTLCITNNDKARESEFTELLHNGHADGAIFLYVDKQNNELPNLAKEFPLVQCCEYCQDESIAHVSIDNYGAAKQVVEYLISLGHSAIGFVGSKNHYISSEERLRGYESALEHSKISPDNRAIAYADDDYNFKSGIRAAKELLSRAQRPTAIFCISDVLALGALRAAEELGLKVPQDVSIVGFDDVEYASMFKPMLTTVSQPGYSLGKTSADLLIKKINSKTESTSVFLEHKLILRDSTAANKA